MKRVSLFTTAILAFFSLTLTSCSDDSDAPIQDAGTLQSEILVQSAKVCENSYIQLHDKSTLLLQAIQDFVNQPDNAKLATCRELWKDTRSTWEKSEAWLFGPVSANSIDPRIDTWPIDFNALEDILSSTDPLTEDYVDGLPDALKGFHPIEYLLWGENGQKTADEFTDREKEFLLALGENLNNLTASVKGSWVNGYTTELATAGDGSTVYSTKKEALLQLVNAMAGICDEVANAKIKTPYDLQDPTQAESPYSENSFTDFTNNIKGIMIMYKGDFNENGLGVEDFVRQHNSQLDNQIKTAYNAAVASLDAIDVPFKEAIVNDPNKIQNAMSRINELKSLLEGQLVTLVQQYGN